MKIKISTLKRIIKEAVERQELSREEVREKFHPALDVIEQDDPGALGYSENFGGEEFPYLTFYLDHDGSLLMSNYEIGWRGWSRWNEQEQTWEDADDLQAEDTQETIQEALGAQPLSFDMIKVQFPDAYAQLLSGQWEDNNGRIVKNQRQLERWLQDDDFFSENGKLHWVNRFEGDQVWNGSDWYPV